MKIRLLRLKENNQKLNQMNHKLKPPTRMRLNLTTDGNDVCWNDYRPSDNPTWPQFWKKEDLLAVKGSLSVGKWEAQWQQNPTSETSAILKRDWWKKWEPKDLPKLTYVMQSYDTAFSKKEHADYSAITTWGVFYPPDGGTACIILDMGS